MVNSASVRGGCPERVQESAPAQSPVAHLPLLPLKEQPVRPHTLPELVPAGTPKVHVPPGRVELRAAADGGGRWPHREAAVVSHGEGGRVGAGCKGGDEKEEDRRGSH